jgi:hypothetical protein
MSFFVGPDGQLDRLVLQNVPRRPIGNDKGKAPPVSDVGVNRFYDVDGDSFVLRYSEAITLNIQYVRMMSNQEDIPADAAVPVAP